MEIRLFQACLTSVMLSGFFVITPVPPDCSQQEFWDSALPTTQTFTAHETIAANPVEFFLLLDGFMKSTAEIKEKTAVAVESYISS